MYCLEKKRCPRQGFAPTARKEMFLGANLHRVILHDVNVLDGAETAVVGDPHTKSSYHCRRRDAVHCIPALD